MAEGSVRIAAVVRHREAVLLCREASGAGWRLPTWPVDGVELETAFDDLLAALDIGPVAVERIGEVLPAAEPPLIPVWGTAADRTVGGREGCQEPTWRPPAVLRRQADDRWWVAYAAVAPTVDTIATDTERGSTAIAIDALWALRDVATEAEGTSLRPVATTARHLLDARPAMAALGNRIDRAMANAATPAEVEAAATDGIVRAAEADAGAAELAAGTVAGSRVLTLSRSSTIRDALLDARPSVVVLASRPGGEGRVVASELADAGLAVTTVPDAAVYERTRAGDIDAVLVGADSVTPEGGIFNKVGTWALAHAANRVDIPFYAVCASDKVRPAAMPEDEPPFEPVFDLTPSGFVTALLTERGRLGPEAVAAVASDHRDLRGWRE